MGLPTNDTAWPPIGEGNRYNRIRQSSIWYGGDPEQLQSFYVSGSTGAEIVENGIARRAFDAVRKFFWGAPPSAGEKNSKIHVPIAQDIATLSSELLFSETPMVKVDAPKIKQTGPDGKEIEVESESGKRTQERLDKILDKINFQSMLLAAAETQSPLGSVALRVAWDKAIEPEFPFISRVDADATIPEYSWGRLTAVTFWRVVEVRNQTYYRHLERHERGKIYHALYVGSPTNLGRIHPLGEHPATENLAAVVNAEGFIPVNARYRFATSIPNMLPDPLDRQNAAGRGDYTPGVISMMDAADEVATSLMRDVDLAKARLIVANYMLEDNGPGKGATFDGDRRVMSPLNMAPGENGDAPITMVQFKIRVTEHLAALDYFANKAVKSAGYTPDTDTGDGGRDVTATEVKSRNSRSLSTRDKKILYWQNELENLLEALLQADVDEFGSGIEVFPVRVTWAPAVQPDTRVLAETANFMRQAKAASDRVIVQTLHPDWDDTQINDEVEAIQNENGVVDPNALGLAPPPPVVPPVDPTAPPTPPVPA